MTTSMHWKGGLQFEATGEFGHTITTDVSVKGGGEGAGHRPTELLLWGVASCTGVDVIRILKKQRQEVTGLEIEVTAHQHDDYPKYFHTFDVRYKFRGKNLSENRIKQAIELSECKYCSVSQTIVHEGKVNTSFEVVGE
jgi:putative redox protein